MRTAGLISVCVCMSTGNNLGDEGVEQIVQTMRDLERADSLGTFRYARSSNVDSGGVIHLLVFTFAFAFIVLRIHRQRIAIIFLRRGPNRKNRISLFFFALLLLGYFNL